MNLPDLSVWPLSKYPHRVFYMERPEHIDVWRVLHGQPHAPDVNAVALERLKGHLKQGRELRCWMKAWWGINSSMSRQGQLLG